MRVLDKGTLYIAQGLVIYSICAFGICGMGGICVNFASGIFFRGCIFALF